MGTITQDQEEKVFGVQVNISVEYLVYQDNSGTSCRFELGRYINAASVVLSKNVPESRSAGFAPVGVSPSKLCRSSGRVMEFSRR